MTEQTGLGQAILDHLTQKPKGLTMTDIVNLFRGSHGRIEVSEKIGELVKSQRLEVKEIRGVRYYSIPQPGENHEHRYKNIRRN